MPGLTVDGTDVLAVYEVMQQAVARARAGDGPSLIECKTYRWYTDTPDEQNPQSGATEETFRGDLKDPLSYFANSLSQQGVANVAELQAIDREVAAAIEEAVAFAKSGPLPRPEDALTHVFAL